MRTKKSRLYRSDLEETRGARHRSAKRARRRLAHRIKVVESRADEAEVADQ